MRAGALAQSLQTRAESAILRPGDTMPPGMSLYVRIAPSRHIEQTGGEKLVLPFAQQIKDIACFPGAAAAPAFAAQRNLLQSGLISA